MLDLKKFLQNFFMNIAFVARCSRQNTKNIQRQKIVENYIDIALLNCNAVFLQSVILIHNWNKRIFIENVGSSKIRVNPKLSS